MDEPIKNDNSIRAELQQRGIVLAREATALKVVDQQTATQASAKLALLKDVVKRWKEYWKKPKADAAASLQTIRNLEADLLDRAEPAMSALNGQLGVWTLRERERVRKEQEARDKAEWEAKQREREAETKIEAEEIVDFEDVPLPMKAELPPAPVKPDLGELQARDHWVFDLEDLDKVPRRFLELDRNMVQDHVTLHKEKCLPGGEFEIPGIKVFNKPIMAVKRRTA